MNRRLAEDVTATVARGMKWIAVELNWTAIYCGHKQRDRPISARHRRRVIEKLAGDGPFYALGKWDQVGFWPPATAHPKPGERDRRAHQFQEAAARPFVAIQLRSAGWEFALQPLPKLWRIA